MFTKQPWPLLLLVLALAFTLPAVAQWQENGFVPDPEARVRTSGIECVADGQGGMIYTWEDERDEEVHIYAQHIDDQGNALWPSGGLPICTYVNGDQYAQEMVSDGSGGAYIVWLDYTTTGSQAIYGQHVTFDGTLSWNTNGIYLSLIQTNAISSPSLCPGEGETAFLVWNRWNGSNPSIRAMLITPSGRGWDYPIVLSSDSSINFLRPLITQTYYGATAVWLQEETSGVDQISYCTFTPEGTILGLSLASPSTVDQSSPFLASDSNGGFVVAWYEGTFSDLSLHYAYHRYTEGMISHLMNKTLCDVSGGKWGFCLTTASNGVIAAWVDDRYDTEALYAQHIALDGSTSWTTNGRAICSYNSGKNTKAAIADGAGGTLIVWEDSRAGIGSGLYSQRISASGYTTWASAGVPLTAHGSSQNSGCLTSDGNGGLLAAWNNTFTSPDQLTVQRLDRSGHWGYPAPTVSSVTDIPADQGGRVLVAWDASRLDPWPYSEIDNYTVWRALDADKAGLSADPDWLAKLADSRESSPEPLIRAETTRDKTTYWELAGAVDAYHLPGYSLAVETYNDHTEDNPGLHLFQVIAHGGNYYWISEPGQGWSEDNLAPAEPMGLAGNGSFDPAGLELTWRPNSEADLHHYTVHRGLSADFVPAAGNLVSAPTDTTTFDTGWDLSGSWYYKVAAVDIHGNTGEFALLEPDLVSGVQVTGLPAATRLVGNHPNPFNPSTSIAYDLAGNCRVRLDIFDTSGRLVRTLVDETQAAGRRTATWQGRDDQGRRLSSGVYLYRLRAGDFRATGRMTLIK